MDDDFETSERISEDLKRRIRFLVKWTRKKDGGWDDVADEIVNRFYPSLSKLEKLVCRCILQTARDLESVCCPCEEIELRLYENYAKSFGNKYRIKNTIIVLCAKGVIKWMTMLTPIKCEDGNLRILRGETYSINPEIIQDIAYSAFGEICELGTGGPRVRRGIPLPYKSFLTAPNSSRQFFPEVN